MSNQDELVLRGREIIATGQLQKLREELGLTRNAMAELLHTSPLTYTSWEVRAAEVTPWSSMAERVARFYEQATKELVLLAQDDVEVSELMPFHLVATHLGIPQELLLKRYRDGEFEAVDTGILGLWIYRDDLPKLARR